MRLRLIVHDVRSCHNVGSLLRTAEGLGVEHVYLSGYTPYPIKPGDDRMPHMRNKIHKQIQKTALGAEEQIAWSHLETIGPTINQLKNDGFLVVALEQTKGSVLLPEFKPSQDVTLVLGREVEGVSTELLALCDQAVEIPMFGKKESFNVVQAAAMALYHCRFVG